jgi:hypothetical protein
MTRREHQINIRLTTSEIAALEHICVREDRDKSYLVRWFTRWGLEHYERVGSLTALKSTKIITPAQSVVDSEVHENAEQRLQVRKEAQNAYGRSAHSPRRKAVNEKA